MTLWGKFSYLLAPASDLAQLFLALCYLPHHLLETLQFPKVGQNSVSHYLFTKLIFGKGLLCLL